MGNRAVITTSTSEDIKNSKDIGIYIHWNGGRDSVEGFLKFCELCGYESPETNNFGWAYLCKVIANYFGDGLSIGIDTCDHLDCDNYDNGVYVIRDWKIVDRKYFEGEEQNNYPLIEMLKAINDSQPENQKLDESIINSVGNV